MNIALLVVNMSAIIYSYINSLPYLIQDVIWEYQLIYWKNKNNTYVLPELLEWYSRKKVNIAARIPVVRRGAIYGDGIFGGDGINVMVASGAQDIHLMPPPPIYNRDIPRDNTRDNTRDNRLKKAAGKAARKVHARQNISKNQRSNIRQARGPKRH